MEKFDSHPAYKLINEDPLLVECSLLAQYGLKDDDQYHNYGHPLDAIIYAFKEIEEYEIHEKAIPDRVKRNMIVGYLFHDYDVNEPLEHELFATCEERSAYYAEYFLDNLKKTGEDITDDDIKQIKRLILVTSPKYPCENDYERIFCRGDIGNVADSMPIFFVNFIAVYRENQMKRVRERKYKELVDPFRAAEGSIEFLNQYFRQDLTLGNGDWDKTPDGTCRFVASALRNFLQLPTKLREVMIKEKDNEN